MQIEVSNSRGSSRFFRRLLNYDDWRIAGKPQTTQFLDYQVVNSNIEAERDHLRVGDHFVRILTMKEAITETRPLVLDALLKIPANFCVVTEWVPLTTDKARKEVNKRRRHFNISKTGLHLADRQRPDEDEPARCVGGRVEAGRHRKPWRLPARAGRRPIARRLLAHHRAPRPASKAELDQLVGEFAGVFTNADGNLFSETYNQLNAYFATVPGNYALNLRKLYLLNTNYADLSFLFTILPGEKTNAASRHGVPGRARNGQRHSVLSQPAQRRSRPHAHSRDDRIGQVLSVQFSSPKRTEVRAAHVHLRYRRQLPVSDHDLRRHRI